MRTLSNLSLIVLFCVVGLASGFTLTVNTTIHFTADPRYVSITLDMWEGNVSNGKKWGEFGALQINFSDWRLQQLASALAPAVLRIGGSPEDSITYLVNGTECADARPPNKNYQCSQLSEYQYGCLTMPRWGDMAAFAAATNLDLVFGLNACYNRPCDTCPMDLSNIQNFLNYTKYNNVRVWGFEFGNELTHNVNSGAYANDVIALKKIMTDIWPDLTTQPHFIMPDVPVIEKYDGTKYVSRILSHFKDGQAPAHALSMHEYPECVPTPGGTAVLEPDCLNLIQQTADAFAQVARHKVSQLWVGESADHSGGGIPGITNTFISSFYYADQLGALASVNQFHLAARQCFIGGDYELVNRTTLQPNPDYWIAFLHKKLLSPSVLPLTLSGSNSTYNTTHARAYSFCSTMGGVGVLVINLDTQIPFTANINFTGVVGPIGDRLEYHLTAQQLSDDVVLCNGVPLSIDEYWQPIMPDTPTPVSNEVPIVVAPGSITFVRFPTVFGQC